MPRRGRKLTPDERALWQRVAATTDRGARADPKAAGTPDESGTPREKAAPTQRVPAPENLPARASLPAGNSLRPGTSLGRSTAKVWLAGEDVGPVGRPEAGLDRRTADRLRRGVREPDARIDLHGMTAERAHRACLTFLSDAMARGLRVVLVITGKGRGEGGRGRGVLRASLPGWLRASPLGGSIVGIYTANQRHGGDGAFYVYLKRRR